jgi:hypothetical protein
MYDQLTGRYTFACPARGEVRIPLSRFRVLERLPGAAHPAVFKITFACDCGAEHDGLVTHDELDWAPLAGSDEVFLNVMTARLESAASASWSTSSPPTESCPSPRSGTSSSPALSKPAAATWPPRSVWRSVARHSRRFVKPSSIRRRD